MSFPKLIVSMTSYPARFEAAAKALEPLFRQSVSPDSVQLWLAEDEVSIIVIATDFLDDEHGEAEAQPAPASQPAASSDAVFGATTHKPVYDGTDADIDKLINLLNNNNN